MSCRHFSGNSPFRLRVGERSWPAGLMFLIVCFVSMLGTATGQTRRPNILLIVADDLGFSDLGCYGSEIETPNLDRLAAEGLRLTQFYTTGRCCPSRASILTGFYPHQVGLGHMIKDLGQAGYRGRVSENVKSIAQLLGDRGYRAYLSGKWHLGTEDPTKHGFEEFFGTLTSAQTYWDANHFLRISKDRNSMVKDAATRAEAVRQERRPFYGTDALADYAIHFLESSRESPDEPWFLYLAFNAPHFPLHAPQETIAKYANRYSAGWDQLRERRLERMKELGILSEATQLTPRSDYFDWGESTGSQNPAWESLPQERQMDLSRRMAIYAAMVDRMDQNVGRLLAELEGRQELENTLIVFTSDNGGCAEWDAFGFDIKSGPENILHRDDQIQQMGSAGTYHSVGSGWANTSNTPWRMYKHFNHEGGIAVPCIIHWPEGAKGLSGVIDDTPTHLIDLVPTFLDVTRLSETDSRPEVIETPPPKVQTASAEIELPGTSLAPLLRSQSLVERTLFFEHEGNRAVRQGRWKLVALRHRPWELYDILSDRTEMNDLAAQHPEMVRRLSEAWEHWAEKSQVTPLPEDYGVEYIATSPVEQP